MNDIKTPGTRTFSDIIPKNDGTDELLAKNADEKVKIGRITVGGEVELPTGLGEEPAHLRDITAGTDTVITK